MTKQACFRKIKMILTALIFEGRRLLKGRHGAFSVGKFQFSSNASHENDPVFFFKLG